MKTPLPATFAHLHHAIRTSDRILLVAHKKPDGDTLGSSSSVLNWLLREGKDVTAFCLDTPPVVFRYLDNIHQYTNDPSVFDQPYDLVIIFDSGDLKYCGVDAFIPRLPPGYLLVNLDHHRTNTHFAHLNIVLTDASSTAEVVHRFYEANRIRIDSAMATSLLTGLFTDTSSFTNAATNPIAVRAASKLLAAGGRQRDIEIHLMHDKTVPSLRIWGTILSRLRYDRTHDVATTYLMRSDAKEVSTDIIEGVSNFLAAMLGETDTICFLRELPDNKVKGSFRSHTRDVSKVAMLMGGGGHKLAAGFTVDGHIEETSNGPRIAV